VSIPRKIAYNVVISSIAKILSTGVALVGIGFITRYLGQEGFGQYSTALAFLSLFGALGDWGLYQASTREISRPNADEKKIISNALGIRLFISFGIIILSPLIVSFLPYPRELKLAIILIAFSYVFSSGYQGLIGLFQKRLELNKVTVSELVGKIVQVTLIIIGVGHNWGFYFIVSTLLINMIINFSIVLLLSRKYLALGLNFDFAYWKKFLRQSIPIGLGAVVTFIYFKADTILLSLLQPQDQVGIYGAACKVIENISFFPAMIVGLTMPMFSFHIINDKKMFRKIVNKNFKIFMILAIPLVIGIWFLSDTIIAIIAGSEFQQSAISLKIIILSLGFIFFGNLFNNVLIAAKLQKQLLFALSFCAFFNIAANLIFIPKYSYYSTSYISVITELLVVILGGWLIRKNLGFVPKTDNLFLMLLGGFVMGVFLWYFNDLNFILKIIISPIIYFGLLIGMKVITKDELQSVLLRKQA
jgi:O-antigen/teichoic acid export membrane protein